MRKTARLDLYKQAKLLGYVHQKWPRVSAAELRTFISANSDQTFANHIEQKNTVPHNANRQKKRKRTCERKIGTVDSNTVTTHTASSDANRRTKKQRVVSDTLPSSRLTEPSPITITAFQTPAGGGSLPPHIILFLKCHCDHTLNPTTNISIPDAMWSEVYVVAYEGRKHHMRKIHGVAALNRTQGHTFVLRDEHKHRETTPLNEPHQRGLELNILCVHEQSRKKGIASALLKECMAFASKQHCRFIITEPDSRAGDTRTHAAKPELVRLFRKHHFQTVTPYLNPDQAENLFGQPASCPTSSWVYQPPDLRLFVCKPKPKCASNLQISRILTNLQQKLVKMIWVATELW